MNMKKKQGFLYGSAILMASAVLVKIIGALFKIPLTNILGGSGMGYFSTAYSIFMPIYAVTVTGLPSAAAKCTADRRTVSGDEGAAAVKSVALRFFGIAGLIGTLLLMTAAYPMCKYVLKDMYAFPAAVTIAPSVAAGCLAAVYRGYYEGLRDMYPTALSQTVEGIVKLFLGLALCKGTFLLAENYPDKFLRLIGCENRGIDPMAAAVPYGAAAAVLGVTLSSFAGLITVKLWDSRQSFAAAHGVSASQKADIRAALLKIAFPAAIGALVTNLTSLIDLVTVSAALRQAVKESPQSFGELSGGGIAADDLPNFIYGSFTGLAVTLFNLVPSLTNMFGKSMLPAAASAKAAGDNKHLGECAQSGLFAAALISVPAGLGIMTMSRQIMGLLFSGRTLEISACGSSMIVLGAAVPFVCTAQTAFALLQAADKADIPVKLTAAGAAIKLAGNLLFWKMGVTGAALATLVCYVFICTAAAASLKKYAFLDVNIFLQKCAVTAVCGILCALTAKGAHILLGERDGIYVLISCGAGGAVFFASAALSGLVSRESMRKLLA